MAQSVLNELRQCCAFREAYNYWNVHSSELIIMFKKYGWTDHLSPNNYKPFDIICVSTLTGYDEESQNDIEFHSALREFLATNYVEFDIMRGCDTYNCYCNSQNRRNCGNYY
jgi:hypothetical protein